MWLFTETSDGSIVVCSKKMLAATMVHTKNAAGSPLKVIGHTANVVMDNAKRNEKMVVIFGYSTEYGVLNAVQEFNFGTRQWRVVKTRGYPVTGSYGHSSSWDPLSRKIYVVGGYQSAEPAGHQLTNTLYSYDPASRTW
uniref:Attractin/MKLN-like beta-propeller domain-containing protein n=1 Tax=Timema cristinae TaxID=61476 RepID=A0A7R9CGQ6_TIMCR|nr:unnamed protein product [Timema cristinae]